MKINILLIDDTRTGDFFNKLDNKDEWILNTKASEGSEFKFLNPFDYKEKLANFYAEIRSINPNIIFLDNKIERDGDSIPGMGSGYKLKEIIKRINHSSTVYVVTRQKEDNKGGLLSKDGVINDFYNIINKYIDEENEMLKTLDDIVGNDLQNLKSIRDIIENNENMNLSADKADEIIQAINKTFNIE